MLQELRCAVAARHPGIIAVLATQDICTTDIQTWVTAKFLERCVFFVMPDITDPTPTTTTTTGMIVVTILDQLKSSTAQACTMFIN